MWHVLEHVHDLRDYVNNIYRILKPHGAVFIAVPNINSPDAKTYGPDWAALDVPRHLWHFKHKDIHRLADQFGFRVERIMGMPMDAFYVSMLSEKYRKSGLGFVKGLWNGLRSNLSSASGKNSSSLVYVLKSKDAG
jgi:predicted SAM-dependent methyltransferase